VAALQCDPTEKKPFFHVLPGSLTLTFGMLGCDYHCSYCQNWLTSQALRDSSAGIEPMAVTAKQMVSLAKRDGASLIGSSYNEPLITAEWAGDVFRLAREHGLKTAFISNGNATWEVLEYLRPFTDCYKVDLKSMQDKNYRKLGGLLSTVLETIPRLIEMGFWVEIVTLVIQGFNDSDGELKEAAKFLASISPDIPWHITAFHKDYKMTDPENTSPETLMRAAEIGLEAGLRFVYAGNLPGWVKNYENTYCQDCHKLLVERSGYTILDYFITPDGKCPGCSSTIPGIWW
jgi:pyruvate formate lyase activating enzyme